MSETLLQRVLFLLDRIEAPTISHATAVGYSGEALANLVSNGILGKKFKATRIPRPARFGCDENLVVRETSSGLFGVAEEDDFIEPLPLEEDDRWLYEISISHLVDEIRRDNRITANGFRKDAGLISVGTKSVNNAAIFSVYLSLPNENEQALLARCARLYVPGIRQNAVVLVPMRPAFSPEARRVLGDIQVLSLWEPAERGTLTLDWTPVLPLHTSPDGSVRVFRRKDQMWTLTFDRKTIQMPDAKAKGLHYICELLRRPGKPIQASELMAAAAGQPVGSIAMGSAGAILGDTAISNYRRRLGDLEFEIAEAERNSDLGRKEVLEDEKEQINVQLRSAVGLGGRRRRASDDAEKVRKAVSNAISRAISAIRKHHRPLADHLQRFIDRGQLLIYTSDETPWNF